MPNGKDYVLFYLTLLLESLTHDGQLRFSETIPYNEDMLSVITDTNIDIVRSAMKILQELKMVEILDDKTIYMTEVDKMIGGECWSAEKMRRLREKQKVTLPSHLVTSDVEIELEIEKEIDITICAEQVSPPKGTLPLNDGTDYPIYAEQIEKWESLYPSVDVKQELRTMLGWLESHPQKRKTKRGINAFINGWLAREQDKGKR